MTEMPAYKRIAKEIRDQIVAGVYGVGDRIPSTRELVEREKVAKATVDKVMRKLKDDHLVESQPGVGLVVKEHKRVDGPQDMFLRSTGLGQGIRLPGEKSVLLYCGRNDLPKDVAEPMGLAPYSKAIQRLRRIERNGKPICLCVSWYPLEYADIAPKLLENTRIPQGTPSYLAECLGVPISEGVDTVEAHEADVTLAEHLGLGIREPVLAITSRLTSPDGRLLEYGVYQYLTRAQVSYRYSLFASE